LTGSTWTLRDASAKVLRKLSKDGAGTWSWDEDYIYRGAQLLAAEVPGNTLQFHLDHLGTPRVITGNGGARLSSHTYFPFGREVAAFSTPDAEVMKFTGHERDDVNLDYMHARYYMPFAGRFLSVDPHLDIKENLREPQRWNRYAYVTNNPLRYTDPDGRDRYQEPGFTKPYSEWGEALQMDESTPTVVKAANYAAGGLTALGAAGFMGAGSALTSVARFATAYASRLTTSATAAEMTRRVVSDSNRMNHIFGNPGHKLDGLVRAFGSTDKVVGAVSRAVLSAGKLQTNANGVFSVVVKVGGQNVEVRGRVIKDAI
jgi:RHS repeat-associated protein